MREFTVLLDPDTERRGFTVRVPALPGCITQGVTRAEALASAKEAIELYIESLEADGEPIPPDVAVELTKVAV